VPTFADDSNTEYRKMIGLKEALTKRRWRMREASLLEELKRLPSAMTPCLGAIHDHIRAVFLVLSRMLALSGCRNIQSLRYPCPHKTMIRNANAALNMP
jgi:hypothetical protein